MYKTTGKRSTRKSKKIYFKEFKEFKEKFQKGRVSYLVRFEKTFVRYTT